MYEIDETHEPRTIEELEQALRATEHALMAGPFSPLTIHYTVIMDVLKEGIVVRKRLKNKGD